MRPKPSEYTFTKLILIELQYTYLLTSQLEQQRKYFEQRMTQVEKSAQERVIWSLSLSLSSFVLAFLNCLFLYINFQADVLDVKYKTATDDLDRVKVELQAVNKEKQGLEKKCSHVSKRKILTLIISHWTKWVYFYNFNKLFWITKDYLLICIC